MLYNTLTRKKEIFRPLEDNIVKMYSCGPTVHWFAHIGNLRYFIFVDTLKRVLLYNGYEVKHVMNITDIGHLSSDADEGEDKMTLALKRENKPLTLKAMRELADYYTSKFVDDLRKLNILLPDIMPRASEHIKEDIELIEILEKKGFTYKTSDGIYFDTSKLKDYGKLAGKVEDDVKSRIVNPEKKNHRDFALWKFNEKIGYDSKFGKGFPGWHIECSVMSTKYLGKTFDIHTGGIDHIQIHHTNEIAQNEAAYGEKMANFWLHCHFLKVDMQKMSKSLKNIYVLNDLIERGINPMAFRYLCLTTHYRSELNFTWNSIQSAQKSYLRLKELVNEFRSDDSEFSGDEIKKYEDLFLKAINDDLNTPEALAIIWNIVRSRNPGSLKFYLIEKFDQVLGLKLTEIEEHEIPEEIIKLAEEREILRKNKEYDKADEIREIIRKKGYVVEDLKEGYRIKRLN